MEYFENSWQHLFTGPGRANLLILVQIADIRQIYTYDSQFQNFHTPEKRIKPFLSNRLDFSKGHFSSYFKTSPEKSILTPLNSDKSEKMVKETERSFMDCLWRTMFVIIIQIYLIPALGQAGEVIGQGKEIISDDEFANRLVLLASLGSSDKQADNSTSRLVPDLKNVEVIGNIPEVDSITWKTKVDISGSILHNDLIFTRCIFENGLDFSKSKLFGELILDDTKGRGTFDFSDSDFESNVSFFGCTLGAEPNTDHTERENTGTNLTFAHSSFNKIFDFQGNRIYCQTSFANCRFHDNAIFGKAFDNEFESFRNGKQDENSLATIFHYPDEEVNFNESIFYHRANFTFTDFFNAKFTDVIFMGSAQFIKARFRGDTDFVRTDFKGLADFDRAIFSKNLTDSNNKNYTNFYRSQFEDSVSFSKAIFLIDTAFKRVSFKGKALFTNTLFFSDTSFEMSFFEKEFFGAKINDTHRLMNELLYYGIGCGINDDPEANHPLTLLRKNIADIFLRVEKVPADILEKWKGEVVCTDDSAMKILNDHKIPAYLINENGFPVYRPDGLNNNELIKTVFTGAHFNGEVDLRETKFGEIDFSAGEMITLFTGPVDFSNAAFEKIYLDGTTFMDKVNLPFSESLFRSSRLMSEKMTLFQLFSLFDKDFLRDKNDALNSNNPDTEKGDNSLKELYSQLEPLFRKNMQVMEANEMSVRLAGLNLKSYEDPLTSLFVFFTMPIKNIIFLAVSAMLFFYLCLLTSILNKKRLFARTRELYFKPGKLPLIVYHDLELDIEMIDSPDGREKKHIEHAQKLRQKITWPLYLCLGTFFAIFSLGNVYVTNDAGCLEKMKILRVTGFILLPLFLFSLAKRSVGLQSTVSFLF